MREIRRKLVLVGDGFCGKSTLINSFYNQKPIQHYEPTIFETFSLLTDVHKRKVKLELWDTAGQEEFSRVRPLSYPEVDVVVICFSIDSRESFANVKEIWVPEVRHFCGNRVPILLVATKIDLRMQIQHPPLLRQSIMTGSSLYGSGTFIIPGQVSTRHVSNSTLLFCCRHRRPCTCFHSRVCSTHRLCSSSNGSLHNRDSSFSSGSEHSDTSLNGDLSSTPSSSANLPLINGQSSPVSKEIITAHSSNHVQRHLSRVTCRMTSSNRSQSQSIIASSTSERDNRCSKMNTIYQHNRSLQRTLRSPEVRFSMTYSANAPFDLDSESPDASLVSKLTPHFSSHPNDSGLDLITSQEAQQLSNEINAAALVECSAKLNVGVERVFQTALKLCVRPRSFFRPETCTVS